MNKKEALATLENFLKEADFKIIFDELEGEGGLCQLKGKYYIVINRRLPLEGKIRIIAQELKRLNHLPIPEEVKEIIEEWGNER